MLTNKKILVFSTLVIVGLLAFYLYKQAVTKNSQSQATNQKQTEDSTNEYARIVSTKPDPLEGALVAGSDPIEITFSLPLENAPELKNMIEPKLEYKVELAQDKKTAKFIPLKPYNLGATYTIFIQQDSKFDGGKRLDKGYIFHIHTIRYRGA